jgi:hypothetical protein
MSTICGRVPDQALLGCLNRMVKACWDPELKLPAETRYGAHMDIGQYGDLNTLRWVENEFDPAPNMKHCEVVYGAFPLSSQNSSLLKERDYQSPMPLFSQGALRLSNINSVGLLQIPSSLTSPVMQSCGVQ